MRDINGYEGKYAITEDGVVFSHVRGVYMKSALKKNGYVYITLEVGSVKKTKRVHRLVAEAYLPNPLNLPMVNHIDGVKSNNAVNNLEWVTGRQNNLHAVETGLRSKFNKHYYVYEGEKITICDGLKHACEFMGCSKASIANVLQGKQNLILKKYYVDFGERSTTIPQGSTPQVIGGGK